MNLKEISKFELETKIDIMSEISNISKETNVEEKARYYAALDSILKTIKNQMDLLKIDLIKEKVSQYFEDEDLKVIFEEGKSTSYIDQKTLYKKMEKDGRIEQFVGVCKVTEKDLKMLDDGEKLLSKFKVITEKKTEPSIKVAKLTVEDKKMILNKKLENEEEAVEELLK